MPVAKECPDCGNHSISWVRKNNIRVKECSLCGYLEGNPGAVQDVQNQEEALERGVGLQLYCLIKAIEDFRGFKVKTAENGEAENLIPPYVNFSLKNEENDSLKRFLTSLSLANQRCSLRWTLEVQVQEQVIYHLAPNFHVSMLDISPQDIRKAIADLSILAMSFERDRNLSIWTKG